jgi:L-fucose isomerase-like protein
MLKSLYSNVLHPKKTLLSVEEIDEFMENTFPDLVIVQNITFANSSYVSRVVKNISCPLVLWTLREPVIDGTKLRLNSLTGAYSAGNFLRNIGIKNFEYVFGSPPENNVISKIAAFIKVAKLKKDLSNTNIASIGHTPVGFGFGRALDSELFQKFGVNLICIESRELMNKAKEYNTSEYLDTLEYVKTKMIGLDKIPFENVDSFARLYKAYFEFIQKNNIKALASRCWPDYFVEFKTPVCAVLGILNDNLIAASCESDMLGALSMYLGIELSNNPVFFGDPVSLDEKQNTIIFWHCGMAPCTLAREDKGATVGVHPNRKIGPTMEFGLKKYDNITILRVGRNSNGSFRFFIATGKALDVPQQFLGASVAIQTDSEVKTLVEKSVKDGWEPHFAIIYGNIEKELSILARFLDIEVFYY